jgi:hypothetical protein
MLHPFHSSNHPVSSLWKVHIIKLFNVQFLHSPGTSSIIGPNNPLTTLFSNTLRLVLPLKWATKFHTSIKQEEKSEFCMF